MLNVAAGSLIPQPAITAPVQGRFLGWFKDAACTQPWNFAVDRMPAAPLSLYMGLEPVLEGLVYSVKADGSLQMRYYMGSETFVSIPETVAGKPLSEILPGALDSGVQILHIPASVKTIGEGALRSAYDLYQITVDPANTAYKAIQGCLYTADGKTLIAYPAGSSAREFTVPAGTTRIAATAFSHAQNLEKVVLPGGLLSIASNAFNYCSYLRRIELPAGLTAIGANAFYQCGLDEGLYGPTGKHLLSDHAAAAGLNYNLYEYGCFVDGEFVGGDRVQAGGLLPEISQPVDPERVFKGWQQEGKTTLWRMTVDVMPQADLHLNAVMAYPFTWVAEGAGIRLTKYTGTATTIQVPETIDGKKVLSIAADAFSGVTAPKLKGNKGSVTQSFAAAQNLPFTPLTYPVFFDSYGGTPVAERQVAKGDLLGVSPASTRNNYELVGWYIEEWLGTAWNFASGRMGTEPLTLYAGWRKIDSAVEESGFTYRQENNEIHITGYQGYLMRPMLPASINGLPVVGIDDFAFYGNETLDLLVIPDGVRSIGSNAFGASIISSLTIPASVNSIGDYALANCTALTDLKLSGGTASLPKGMLQGCTGLFTLTIPAGVQSLGEAFAADCAFLETVTLPTTLSDIGTDAFRGCGLLGSLNLPAGLTYISPDALAGCDSLQAINVAAGNTAYKAIDGVLYDSSGTVLMRYPSGKTATSFTVPATVTMINDGAFRDSRLQAITLPAGLAYMGESVFVGSQQLTTLTWPAGTTLTDIPKEAFRNCGALISVTLPASVETIGDGAFSGCYQLKDLRLGAAVDQIGAEAIPDNDWLTLYGTAGSSAQQTATTLGLRFIDPKTMVAVTGIAVSSASLTLPVAQSKQLTATLTPSNTSETKVQWVSSDESVAVVDATGLITGRWTGTATISAYAANGAVARCEVTVVIPALKATAMTFTPAETTLRKGYAGQLSLAFTPAGAGVGGLTWESSAPAIARVDAYGMVTGLATGAATITATATDGSGLKATCKVTVAVATMPGDANADGKVDMLDLTSVTDYIVKGTPCKAMLNADATEDGVVDMLDAIWIINTVVAD